MMRENHLNLMLAIMLLLMAPFLKSQLSTITISAETGLNLLLSGSIVLFMLLAVLVINQPDSDR